MTLPAGLEQVFRAADVEEAFMLAGKARGRQIFRGRGASHRNGHSGPGFPLQLPISFYDLFAEQRRVHRPVYDLAGFGGLARKLLDLSLVETVQKPVKFARDIALRQRIAISLCRDGKTIGDGNPL